MRLTEYQEFVVRTLVFQLNDSWIRTRLKQNGVKDVVKLMTRLYPEFTFDGKKAYRSVARYKKHHRITTRAAKIIDNGGSYKEVHTEHIYPNEQVFQELLALCKAKENVTREDIINILSKSEMIIISQEEKSVLDGKPKDEFSLDGKSVYGAGLKFTGTREERLKAIQATFDPRYEKNSL